MKPARISSETPVLSRARPVAEVGVSGELRSIDTSLLDQLLGIRKEKARLEEYRKRAAELKDSVQSVVWRRVAVDYARRLDALGEQAAPLKLRVRREYRNLRSLFDRINALQSEARLEKEELELRHAVGELPQAGFEERLQAPNGILERCRMDLASLEERKARFLEAFDSDQDLEADASDDHAGPPREDMPASDLMMLLEPDETTPAASRGAAAPAKLPPSLKLRRTAVARSAEAGRRASPELEERRRGGPSDQSDQEDEARTFLLPLAGVMVSADDSTPVAEYRLASLNYVGRSEDNQIQVARPGVSRRHALIVATSSGFTVKDLQSQNGTFVNGEHITERPLSDGDTISIGDTRIVFRSPWPAPDSAKSSVQAKP